jgi:hypothetical protein
MIEAAAAAAAAIWGKKERVEGPRSGLRLRVSPKAKHRSTTVKTSQKKVTRQ